MMRTGGRVGLCLILPVALVALGARGLSQPAEGHTPSLVLLDASSVTMGPSGRMGPGMGGPPQTPGTGGQPEMAGTVAPPGSGMASWFRAIGGWARHRFPLARQ